MKHPAQLNTDTLRSRLKLKSLQSESQLLNNHPLAAAAFVAQKLKPGRLRTHSAKLLATGVTLTSVFLPPGAPQMADLPKPPSTSQAQKPFTPKDLQKTLIQVLAPLPSEEKITEIIQYSYGIHASAELEGHRLNSYFGYIGAEQHLPRFPGDTASLHGLPQSGITPGRGAWGYFAPSKSALTEDEIEKEKYYFAVQTLYLPDWNTQTAHLRDWYKHRKMVAVNPKNGKTLVGVVADSGPAWWTGKQFGGSPEVMQYLELKDGRQKGKIILYFVDDPENKVPLGPLEYNLEHPPLLMAS